MRYKETILEKINYTNNLVNVLLKEGKAGQLTKEGMVITINNILKNQETLQGLVELEK